MWATNRVWLTRAEYLEPFLREHAAIDGPGLYIIDADDVYGSNSEVPDLAKFLNLANYTVPLNGATIGDLDDIRTVSSDGHACQVLVGSDGSRVIAVRLDWLDWLEEAPVPQPDDCLCEIRLLTKEQAMAPVAIVVTPLAPELGGKPEIAAVVMPVLTDREP
jgi:hypothetical protein